MKKNILTIGAYERDNFGDFLFFIVLKNALLEKDCNITAGSIIEADMNESIGEYVYPYHFLLNNYKWDAIWVVGGEIGNVDVDVALSMSFDDNIASLYFNSETQIKKIIANYFFCGVGKQLAYLPSLELYEENRNSFYIVNSVGGFEGLKNEQLSKKTLNELKKVNHLTVRNSLTYDFLKENNISCSLIPDVVHALPYFYNKKDWAMKGSYILFQINESLLNIYTKEKISFVINEIVKKYNCRVCFFSAGTARHHDSIKKYVEIKEYIWSNYNEDRIEIIKERDPLVLVDWISNSKLWIGSSLHGRILSIAYEIPRISLEVEKVSNYCKLWDDELPYNVSLDQLLASCEIAMGVSKDYLKDKAGELSKKAKSNLDDIIVKIYENR